MMTSKERMITAMKNEKPDMVPVAPDMSCYIPCKLAGKIAGKNFLDIFYHHAPPIWKAYIEAVRYFKFDGWFIYGSPGIIYEKAEYECSRKVISQNKKQVLVRTSYKTPVGELTAEEVFHTGECSQYPERLIKNFKDDFPKLRYLFPPVAEYDNSKYRQMKNDMGDDGAVGINVKVPGLHSLMGYFQGELTTALDAYYDNQDMFSELVRLEAQQALSSTEIALESSPDFLMLGASGLWLLSTPDIFREITLPTLKKQTKMAKDAGIPSFLHSCGRARGLVEICANETDLNCINPIEPPPTGDCYLAEIKKKFGNKIAFMGNINTLSLMKTGSLKEIEEACIKAIDDAAHNGGFILSTADELVYETPFENIFKMIDVARNYGKY